MLFLKQKKGNDDERVNQRVRNRINENILERIISPTCPIDPYELLGYRNFKVPRIIPNEEVGTPVQEFFRDATIFITGGTGFVGQVLIEKLLRCCPHINKIYILVRVKMNKSPAQRFENIFQDRLFDRLSYEMPKFRDKVDYVSGSVDEPLLGLSQEDRNKIINDVNIIYHCAASLKFTEILANAIKVNTIGTREVIEVARDIKNLKACLFVSTAYSFCNRLVIEEKLYPMDIEPEAMMELVEKLSAAELENEVTEYIKDWPNTYVFSKALAECLIQKNASDLPVAIFRPSTVISTFEEPLRGWINNLYGPLGLALAFSLGILHIHDGDLKDETIDLVHVDMVVNSLICATREVALNYKTNSHMNKEVPIYNFTNARQNPTTWKFLADVAMEEVVQSWAFSSSMWYPSYISVTFRPLYLILHLLLHKIPGLIIDFTCILTKRKPILTKVYKKLDKVQGIMRYFQDHKWLYKIDNVKRLWKNLSTEDKEIFYFDVKKVNWATYVQRHVLGMRVFMMKDDIHTLPEARKKLKKLYFVHQFLKIIFYGFLLFGIHLLFRFIES